MFFAVVRFSPPSQETEAAKRKAKAKNNSPDSQEPIFNFWLRPRAKPEAVLSPLWRSVSWRFFWNLRYNKRYVSYNN
ncbi:MAG: hypothetical protein A2168_06950 [Planctomycetes bacterium RBG_13_50_24]|nr:MAG: hypothetical protein A2168_06950 [Planctomycetes bacterium RBG_13_50_24]